MNQSKFEFEDGTVEVSIKQCLADNGIIINKRFIRKDGKALSTTVTCTCWDADGNSHSTTKICPDDSNNTCDCSDPDNPSVTCG
jgi:hypothetical protein